MVLSISVIVKTKITIPCNGNVLIYQGNIFSDFHLKASTCISLLTICIKKYFLLQIRTICTVLVVSYIVHNSNQPLYVLTYSIIYIWDVMMNTQTGHLGIVQVSRCQHMNLICWFT